jgi:hypothetical protein
MAAPRIVDQKVGGLYSMTGDPDDGGEARSSPAESSPAEYCSLSECIVMPDSASGFVESSEAIGGKRRSGAGKEGSTNF